ncbi:hypothetical protein NBRC110019_25050 [Neptunitalea chrysea]|uniref:histidine kinase n=1 Tax=Neptunitalea chrysea TaxID=1647581 RepID=A0A9W6EV73_9FLAO|nr:PAS domain S-box protein [Neptunitalea chrysea]GLB53464.1 hypothetical protein NBRC110019_25050 [Neptunitalea chrysea]
MTYLEEELSQYSILAKVQEIKPPSCDGQLIWNLLEPNDIWVTPSFYRNLGYTPHEIVSEGQSLWNKVTSNVDRERIIFVLRNQLQEGYYENILQIKDKKENILWFKYYGYVIFNEERKPARFIAFLQLEPVAEVLGKYYDLEKRANKIAKIGMWEVNMQNETIYWDKQTKSIFGVEEDFICDFTNRLDFYKKALNYDLLMENFQQLYKGKDFDFEVQMQRPDGTLKWVRLIGIPIMEESSCTRAYGIVQDIDVVVNNYQQLEKQEMLYRNMFEYAATSIIQVDDRHRIIKCNNSFMNFIGYTEEELILKEMMAFTHPHDKQKTIDVVIGLKEGRYAYKTLEKRYLHKNGEVLWGLVSLSLIKEKGMQTVLSQIVDITNRKKTEMQVASLMNVTKDQNRRLFSFAQIVSHQLRSHTSDMEMLLSLIHMEHTEGEKDPYFPILSQSVRNLSNTISDLNEVIFIYNQGSKQIEKLHLKTYLDKGIEKIKENLLNEEIPEIVIDISEDVYVNFRAKYLDNIIWQLLDNACKFRSPLAPLKITILVVERKDFVEVTFSDNGLGIDMKRNGHKLFKMYNSFHNHSKARGIGLFLVKNQLEAFGGCIEVSSVPLMGSSFIVYLKK